MKRRSDGGPLSDDINALDALNMVYRQGLSQKDVREKYGLTRSAVSGFFDRDRKAAALDTNPASLAMNGTMPEFWYLDGIKKRKEQ